MIYKKIRSGSNGPNRSAERGGGFGRIFAAVSGTRRSTAGFGISPVPNQRDYPGWNGNDRAGQADAGTAAGFAARFERLCEVCDEMQGGATGEVESINRKNKAGSDVWGLCYVKSLQKYNLATSFNMSFTGKLPFTAKLCYGNAGR
jgi:hypothetical protein